MYKVTFIKHIHSCFAGASSNDVYLEKKVELPFVPTEDICVGVGDLDVLPVEIHYDAESGQFRAYTESDKEIYNAQLHKNDHRPLKEIVDEYIEIGWERRND